MEFNSFEKIKEHYEYALSWLDSIQIENSKTRMGRYRNNLEKLIDIVTKKDVNKLIGSSLEYVNTLYEVNDIIYIHKALESEYGDDDKIRHLLREFCKGPDSYTNENNSSSNRARNLGFELLISAILAKANIELMINIEADVAATFEEQLFIFECKRPQAIRNLQKNIRKAIKQIEVISKERQETNINGVLCIDFTKIINPEFIIPKQKDLNKVVSSIEHRLSQCLLKIRNFITDCLQDRELFVLGTVNIVSMAEQTGDLFYYRDFAFDVFPQNEKNPSIIENLLESIRTNSEFSLN